MGRKQGTDEVVFLGAGSSKPLGHPLTNEILPQILMRLADDDLFSYYKRAAKDRRRLRYLLKYVFPGALQNGSQATITSITSVLSLLDFFLNTKQLPHPALTMTELQELQNLARSGGVRCVIARQ